MSVTELVCVIHIPDYEEFYTVGVFDTFDNAEKALESFSKGLPGSKLDKWNENIGQGYKQYIIRDVPYTGYYNFTVRSVPLNSLKINTL